MMYIIRVIRVMESNAICIKVANNPEYYIHDLLLVNKIPIPSDSYDTDIYCIPRTNVHRRSHDNPDRIASIFYMYIDIGDYTCT